MKDIFTLGVDLGGTKINFGLVDNKGHVLTSSKSFIGNSKEPDIVIDKILEGIKNCLINSNKEIKAIGIGVAAQVDHEGNICGSPNLGWKNFPLKNVLEKKLRLPVIVTNDVRAATLGEWSFGIGKGIKNLIVLFIGTGVGGGAIVDGKILEGATNSGGELGHITIVSEGTKCRCSNYGCLEAYVGGWGIAERTKKAVQNNPDKGKILLSIAKQINNIDASTLSQAYYKGDPFSKKIIGETGRYLADGLVSIVNAFNPSLVIMGGGVIEGIPVLIRIVKKHVDRLALRTAVKILKIEKASLGGNSAVIGAAILAKNFFLKN
jgi:glucokinase